MTNSKAAKLLPLLLAVITAFAVVFGGADFTRTVMAEGLSLFEGTANESYSEQVKYEKDDTDYYETGKAFLTDLPGEDAPIIYNKPIDLTGGTKSIIRFGWAGGLDVRPGYIAIYITMHDSEDPSITATWRLHRGSDKAQLSAAGNSANGDNYGAQSISYNDEATEITESKNLLNPATLWSDFLFFAPPPTLNPRSLFEMKYNSEEQAIYGVWQSHNRNGGEEKEIKVADFKSKNQFDNDWSGFPSGKVTLSIYGADFFGMSGTAGVQLAIESIGEDKADEKWVNGVLITPETLAGAVIRVSDPEKSGLMFTTAFDRAAMDVALSRVGTDYKALSYGTFIVPADKLEGVESFTLEDYATALGKPAAEEGVDYLDVAARGFYESLTSDSQYFIRASIVNIKDYNLYRKFAGIGYIRVTLSNDEVQYVYSDYDPASARSVYEVAVAAFSDRSAEETADYPYEVFAGSYSKYNSEQLSIIKGYIDGTVVIDGEGQYAGGLDSALYTPPYSAVKGDGEITITSETQIRTVVLNGSVVGFEAGGEGLTAKIITG